MKRSISRLVRMAPVVLGLILGLFSLVPAYGLYLVDRIDWADIGAFGEQWLADDCSAEG